MVYNNCESHKMGAAKKYPVNACGVRDGLSGDMLASSRRNLVSFNVCTTFSVYFCFKFNLQIFIF